MQGLRRKKESYQTVVREIRAATAWPKRCSADFSPATDVLGFGRLIIHRQTNSPLEVSKQ
jgi:hypothetical protein